MYHNNNYMRPLTIEQIGKYIIKNCKHNWKTNIQIFRGDSTIENNYNLFLGKSYRKSANTSNYYTLLFSEILDSWKNYPKRNKSLICSNNLEAAKRYGEPLIILPFDNAKIAMLPSDDIWNLSFPILNRLHFNIVDFNEIFFENLKITEDELKSVCKMKFIDFYSRYLLAVKHTELWSYNSWIYSAIKALKISNDFEFNFIKGKFNELYKFKIDKRFYNIRIKDILENILNFNNLLVNNYTNINYSNINEIWTEGPALVIKYNILNDLKIYMDKF